MEQQKLHDLTASLRQMNEEAFDQYVNRTKQEGYETDFYGEVKPFADRVKVTADEWKAGAVEWVMRMKPKYIHPIQIEQAHENINLVSIQAFFTDTKAKRFKEMSQSIEYVLSALQDSLQEMKDHL